MKIYYLDESLLRDTRIIEQFLETYLPEGSYRLAESHEYEGLSCLTATDTSPRVKQLFKFSKINNDSLLNIMITNCATKYDEIRKLTVDERDQRAKSLLEMITCEDRPSRVIAIEILVRDYLSEIGYTFMTNYNRNGELYKSVLKHFEGDGQLNHSLLFRIISIVNKRHTNIPSILEYYFQKKSGAELLKPLIKRNYKSYRDQAKALLDW